MLELYRLDRRELKPAHTLQPIRAMMQSHSSHDVALLRTIPPVALETVTGSIERVDPVQRELTVLIGPQRVEVDVPPLCPVSLRGERIKLRIIQPGDVVRVSVEPRAPRMIAQRVEVAPINSLPAADET